MIQNGPNPPTQDDGGPTPCRLRIGEAFNPWHKVCGFYPPDVVVRQRDLEDGQKRLYERGVRWARKNGTFWRSFPTIAEELGKSVRQVKDDMATLEEKRLIGHARRRRQSNVYHFLWQSIFEVQSTAHQGGSLIVQDSTLEVQDSVKNGPLKVQPTARQSCPSLNFVKQSSSEASDVPPESQPVEANDDESSFSQQTKTLNRAAATPFPATALPLEAPPVPATEASRRRLPRPSPTSKTVRPWWKRPGTSSRWRERLDWTLLPA